MNRVIITHNKNNTQKTVFTIFTCELFCNIQYLDTCASHHSFFVEEYLKNLHKAEMPMVTSCNAGEVTTDTQGFYEDFLVWLNRQGVANLISVPQLEEMGYKVDYHTDREWIVTSPQGTA